MSEARQIELGPVARPRRRLRPGRRVAQRPGGDAAAHRGVPSAAATRSRPTRRSSSPGPTVPTIRRLIDGRRLPAVQRVRGRATEQKTGWTADEILDRVGTRVVTLGPAGVRVERKGEEPIVVPALPGVERGRADRCRRRVPRRLPRGGGRRTDPRARRPGRLRPRRLRRRAVGTQEYSFTREEFLARLRKSATATQLPPTCAGWLSPGRRLTDDRRRPERRSGELRRFAGRGSTRRRPGVWSRVLTELNASVASSEQKGAS